MPNQTNKHKRALLIELSLVFLCLFLAVFIRFLALTESAAFPEFHYPLYDPAYNHYWAKGLATGDWSLPDWTNDPEILTTPYGRPPGYPFFLGAVYKLFGVNPWAPRIVQSALGILDLFLLYLLVRRVFGRGPAIISLVLGALFWAFPYYETQLTYPSVSLLVLLLLFHLMALWAGRPRILLSAAMGLIFGIFGLFRPNGLLFLPFLMIWMFYAARSQRLLRRWLPSVLWLVGGLAVAVALVLIRNWIVARDFVFISAYGGINFYAGNHENAPLTEPEIPELHLLAGVRNWSCFDYPLIVRGLGEHLGKPVRFSEANRWFYHQGVTWIWRNPGDFLKGLWKKTLLFWGPVDVTNDTVPELDRIHSPLYAKLPGFSLLMTLFLAGITLWALAVRYGTISPHARVMASGLLLFLLSYFLSVLPYFVAGRYRMEVVPVMLIFGGLGLWIIFQWLYRKQWRSLITAAFILASAAILAGVNWSGYMPSAATWHLRKAMAASSAGDIETAKNQYALALARGADPATVWNNLGNLALQTGDREQAENLFAKATAADPLNVFAAANLARLRADSGNTEQALALCEEAIRQSPRNPWGWVAAGRIALDEGQYPQALTWLSRAAMLQPENGLIAYDLSRAYYLNGKLQEAIQWGRKAADRLVNMAKPRSNLGWMLGVSGNVEEAEQMLQDALRLKPDLVIARINLAELRLSWNNPTGALDALTDGFDRQQATADWWYTLGRVYEANNDFSGAVQAYREAVNIRPGFAEVWNNLGLIAQKQGQLDDAVSCFQRAIEADPDFMKPRFNLAQVYCASGQTEEARRIFEHLIQQLGPEHPEVNLVKDALNNCSRQNQTAPETR